MKVVSNNIYFTSDTHYNHSGICSATSNWEDKRGTRLFNSLEEMNETIVNNINNTVPENGYLIHLGDWSFGGVEFIKIFRDQIKCKNIGLIYGNHDHHIKKNTDNVQNLFSWTTQMLDTDDLILKKEQEYKNKRSITSRVVLLHYPIASWAAMSQGVIHLHGHVHSTIVGPGKTMDVGIDGHPEFRPYHFCDEIMPKMRELPIKSILSNDHHAPRLR